MGLWDGLSRMMSGTQNMGIGADGNAIMGPPQQGMFGQFQDWAKTNPNQLWMMMDMAGQAFDPNNVAAGVGTKISQAKMMREGQKAADQSVPSWKSDIVGLLDGSGKQTADGVKGITDVTSTIGADGKRKTTFTSNDSDLGALESSPRQQAPIAQAMGGSQPNPWVPRQYR